MTINKYFVDARIISLLYRTDDEKTIQEILNKFLELQVKLEMETAAKYLTEKGMPEQKVIDYIEGQAEGDQEVNKLIKSMEFEKLLEENNNALLGVIFAQEMEKLDDSEKKQIEDYMTSSQEKLEEVQNLNREVEAQMDMSIELIKELGLTDQEVKEMIDKALEEAYSTIDQNSLDSSTQSSVTNIVENS